MSFMQQQTARVHKPGETVAGERGAKIDINPLNHVHIICGHNIDMEMR